MDELTGRSIREQNSDLEAILNSKLCEAEYNGEIGAFVEQHPAGGGQQQDAPSPPPPPQKNDFTIDQQSMA